MSTTSTDGASSPPSTIIVSFSLPRLFLPPPSSTSSLYWFTFRADSHFPLYRTWTCQPGPLRGGYRYDVSLISCSASQQSMPRGGWNPFLRRVIQLKSASTASNTAEEYFFFFAFYYSLTSKDLLQTHLSFIQNNFSTKRSSKHDNNNIHYPSLQFTTGYCHTYSYCCRIRIVCRFRM